MDAADAHIFTIPAGHGFVDALAAGLWRQAGHDPLRLSRATVLLPTRRSVRALREAFLRLGDGRPMLLPAMRALGDEDDGEVALNAGLTDDDVTAPIGVLQRQFLLARLIVEMGRPGPAAAPMAFDQALRLAQALADLIDQIHTEGLDFAGFETLVPDELADHWQVTLRFLEILTAHWPAILAATGSVDPAVWRNRVLARQAEAWRRQPP
ncbi:MAG: double-strand break repair protein AddB, partial [Pseudomonadota bacterium]|nr:double-strand break repair protein AddB [Pseudomonadota bacterium]